MANGDTVITHAHTHLNVVATNVALCAARSKSGVVTIHTVARVVLALHSFTQTFNTKWCCLESDVRCSSITTPRCSVDSGKSVSERFLRFEFTVDGHNRVNEVTKRQLASLSRELAQRVVVPGM